MTHYLEDIGALPRESLLGSYLTGFAISVLCTLTAYLLVAHRALAERPLILTIAGLALVQVAAQAMCFLHLGIEKGSRLKLLVFCFAILVVGILVSGSIWIMLSLNQRMHMDSSQMQQYMSGQGGF